MKILILTLSNSLFLSAGTLFAASVWAPGVTETSGWYDVNKRSNAGVTTVDRKFCWGAVASNMLHWWCDTYEASGKTLPSEIPNTRGQNYSSAIFEDLFLKNWDPNKGADSSSAGLLWFFEGRTDTLSSNNSRPLENGPQKEGNFFKEADGWTDSMKSSYESYVDKWKELPSRNGDINSLIASDYMVSVCGRYYTWGAGKPQKDATTAEVFSNYLTTMLQYGPVGLGISLGSKGTGNGHEITAWGCDVDENGIITAIYATDSDDAQSDPTIEKINRYTASYGDNYYAINYSPELTSFGGNYINNLTGIMGYPIPEPSAFGLLAGLAALALAGTRRSRRKFEK